MTSSENTRPVWGERWEALRTSRNHRGGQGQVWAVRDRQRDDRLVYALKLLDPKASPAKLKRFAREIDATQRLRTSVSGIVEIVDDHVSDTPGGVAYYVMPWAWSTLKDQTGALKGGAGLERTLELLLQVGRTLAACHTAEPRVIHRDVKPANILLTNDHTPILADFGICFLDEDERLTHTRNETLGSYGFTAPELFGGGVTDDVGPAADIYSLGMTLYAVSAGGSVFPLDRHCEPTWNLAAASSDGRLEHLHGLLDRMTALRPQDRFASMSECVAAMEQAIGHLRAGVRYAEGMYSGHPRAASRMYQLRRDMTSPTVDEQHRAFVAALNESVSVAKQIAASAPPLPPVRHGGTVKAYQVPDETRTLVGDISDELLAPIGAAMAEGARDQVVIEEWAERLAVEAGGELYEDHARLFRAGISIAVHVAGAVAWRRGFISALAAIVKSHQGHVHEWNHLDVFNRDASGVPQLVVHVAGHAASLNWLGTADRSAVRDAVAEYTGLVLLRDLQLSTPDVQKMLDGGEVDSLDIPALSCLFYPHTDWTMRLGDDLAGSRIRRQALAREVFGVSDEELRGMLHRYRLVVIRLIARCNRERSMFHMGLPGYRLWGKWSMSTT